jgi:L-arabinokinase
MSGPTVCLAVSGHGFGHAVRCAEVARALVARGARVVLRSDAPQWLFPAELVFLPDQGWPIDVGVAQHDGLELDIDETRRRWTEFAAHFGERAEVEAQLLVQHGVDVVIGDIPPVAFEAASRAHIASVALGNFGWDWIYEMWPDFDDIVRCVRSGYMQADRLLRLPLHAPDGFQAFKQIEDVPLIARHASRSRHAVRAELRLAESAPVVLLSFGGFTANGLDLTALGEWSTYVFMVTPPIVSGAQQVPANVRALNEMPADYVSLLAACDVVVTKPGYGIVADCLANRVAVLFTDRGPFREYDVLAQALPTLGRARYVPQSELRAGHLGPHLDALLESTAAWTEQRMDGAEFVAERVVQNVTIEQNLLR